LTPPQTITVVSRAFFYVVSNASRSRPTRRESSARPEWFRAGDRTWLHRHRAAVRRKCLLELDRRTTSGLAPDNLLDAVEISCCSELRHQPVHARGGTFTGLFLANQHCPSRKLRVVTLKLTGSGGYSGSCRWLARVILSAGISTSMAARQSHHARDKFCPWPEPDASTWHGLERITGNGWRWIWSADLLANRSVFNAHEARALGRLYTLIVPGHERSGGWTGGDSYGTVKVGATANVKLSGKLADKRPSRKRAPLSKNGAWPLYLSLYSKKGSLCSWFNRHEFPAAGLNGILDWFKPTMTKGLYQRTLHESVGTDRLRLRAAGCEDEPRGHSCRRHNHGEWRRFERDPHQLHHLAQDNKVATTNTGLYSRSRLSDGLFKGKLHSSHYREKNLVCRRTPPDDIPARDFFLETNSSGQVSLR